MHTKDITYSDGSASLLGFLACDEKAEGKRPGILVVHEGLGLEHHAMTRARMLAELGYVGFAADMFGDRRQAQTVDESRGLIGPLRGDRQLLLRRARAALQVLAELPQVDDRRLGAIGFCFGGLVVLELARDGADLRAVVSFHGILNTTMPARAGKIGASILVCTGADDPLVPPQQVRAFEEEMRAANVSDWQVLTLGNTRHGFTNPAADGSIFASALYDEASDRRSWMAMRAVFNEAFIFPVRSGRARRSEVRAPRGRSRRPWSRAGQ